jgi:hypothetical protein
VWSRDHTTRRVFSYGSDTYRHKVSDGRFVSPNRGIDFIAALAMTVEALAAFANRGKSVEQGLDWGVGSGHGR